ncbi:MAG: glutamyl-tRNA(Gln) amidotransferase subunit E [Candidatus Bathyarchaeota archaeon B23]|nr:MAG: glutamyl-tRNA(Gln) amidotransferase subunit E [Candidatus Bathyarchaeota archaeon B23]
MIDYEAIGLKVGLEVHQELDTRHKLFCHCPPRLFREEPEYTFVRRLRPSQSELGEVDPAALFEFLKGKTIVYEASRETDCLVEMDEEPPGPLNDEALDICLTFALMVEAQPVDEVHVMRKIVVDGSNTTGFQRTCVVALGGAIEVEGKRYHLEQICLEEDAARKIAEEGGVVRYRIDRLGIPLIEVTTAPEIRSPEEARRVAHAIGRILRATGRVQRGLGTIRQDLNISIEGGALIEIKGVQELDLVSKVIEYEALRQLRLLEIAEELRRRGLEPSELEGLEPLDVSELFRGSRCRILRRELKRKGRIYALRLPRFGGLLGRELCPGRRLGTEMADRAKFWGGVEGILHTDELPGYDITEEEVEALRERVGAGPGDAVILVAGEAERCRRALRAVLERALEALEGVPSETRAANPDGTTHYTRPRPGPARMYPETDVISTPITEERLGRLRERLPEMPEEKLRRFMEEYGLNEKLARQVIDSDYASLFEELAQGLEVSPTLMAVTLTETLKSLSREGVRVERVGDEALREVFGLIEEGAMMKEAIPDVLTWLVDHPEASPRDALRELGLELLSIEELRGLILRKIEENRGLIEARGEKAFGPLMGRVMAEVRGRANPAEVQRILREVLRERVEGSTP